LTPTAELLSWATIGSPCVAEQRSQQTGTEEIETQGSLRNDVAESAKL